MLASLPVSSMNQRDILHVLKQVNSEKSMKNVANFLAQQVTQLSPLEGTSPRDVREFEVWLPSKIIKAYNWRSAAAHMSSFQLSRMICQLTYLSNHK